MRDLLLLLAALHTAFGSSTQSLNLLPKSVRFLYLNIGANVNPIFPPLLNHSIAAVAFEPIVHSAIPKKANLYVVPAAVGAVGGLGMMGVYNNTCSSRRRCRCQLQSSPGTSTPIQQSSCP